MPRLPLLAGASKSLPAEAAAAPLNSSASPVPVTIASYNIRKAIGADRRRRPERILGVLSEIAPDIVVIQEADRRFGNRHSALPDALLRDHGWRAIPFAARDGSIGWHGNAILISPRVAITAHDSLQLPTLEPRGAVAADLAVGGRRLRLVGMHLDLSGLWRRRQARTILDYLDQRDRLPTLMMGDLNEWRAAAGCIADFAATHKPVPTGPSFPARMPLGRLDRIFASDDLRIDGAGVHHSPQAAVASDHLPLWVRVRI